MDIESAANAIAKRAHYSPPWADVSLIGIAGSSGSGKSTLSRAIVNKLNLPWVVILSMVSLIAQPSIGSVDTDRITPGFILQKSGPRSVEESIHE